MKKNICIFLVYFVFLIFISNNIEAHKVTYKKTLPDNSYEVLDHLCHIINQKPVGKRNFFLFKKYITIFPCLLLIEHSGYTLAERINNRSANREIDLNIEMFFYKICKEVPILPDNYET